MKTSWWLQQGEVEDPQKGNHGSDGRPSGPGVADTAGRQRGGNTLLTGRLAAVGPIPIPGARHDAYAVAASGLRAVLADLPTLADLGYAGVEGIELVPRTRIPGTELTTS